MIVFFSCNSTTFLFPIRTIPKINSNFAIHCTIIILVCSSIRLSNSHSTTNIIHIQTTRWISLLYNFLTIHKARFTNPCFILFYINTIICCHYHFVCCIYPTNIFSIYSGTFLIPYVCTLFLVNFDSTKMFTSRSKNKTITTRSNSPSLGFFLYMRTSSLSTVSVTI